MSADYSQIELRIMAHLSKATPPAARLPHGEDIHRATAAEIRRAAGQVGPTNAAAKTINFGLIYGMSAFGLAAQIEIDAAPRKALSTAISPATPAWRLHGAAPASRRANKAMSKLFGRRLWLPDIHAANAMKRQGAERAAINAPMQAPPPT